MTLPVLLLYVGIAAVLLTALNFFVFKTQKNWIVTFLQNYCGSLFIFSGWVKAVDPLGTAYKMEQYFTEFEATFEATWLSFIAPLFPWLSNYAVQFAVLMIIFEIILGLILVMGSYYSRSYPGDGLEAEIRILGIPISRWIFHFPYRLYISDGLCTQ